MFSGRGMETRRKLEDAGPIQKSVIMLQKVFEMKFLRPTRSYRLSCFNISGLLTKKMNFYTFLQLPRLFRPFFDVFFVV